MGFVITSLFKGLWWFVATVMECITVPLTIMNLDDGVRNLKGWFDE